MKHLVKDPQPVVTFDPKKGNKVSVTYSNVLTFPWYKRAYNSVKN